MENMLLLGAEAIAQGAIDAGLSGVYAYPGTPSTEITTYIQNSKEAVQKGIRSSWSTNEKTAYEAAIGMSFTGKRSMVCMKHVGLNVAADAFINSAVTGVNGGLILVVADDPSMHSSQNEQDSRFFGKFAMIPVIEPSTQQEAYDAVRYGFEISEKYKTPVMMRIPTRLSHSRSGIVRKEPMAQNPVKLPDDPVQFMLLPAYSRIKYHRLVELQQEFENESEKSALNSLEINNPEGKGVIAFGIGYNYLMENIAGLQSEYNILKISQYPMPRKKVEELFKNSSKVLVLEEGYPIYEELLRGYLNDGNTFPIDGKLNGVVVREGELTPDNVAVSLSLKKSTVQSIDEIVKGRPPQLCQGCSHRDTFDALNAALADVEYHKVFADIGCYTLGALPPYNAVHTCVDMGASITMAKGAADAGFSPAVAVIGDSTFTHSGITGLLDAVNDHSPVTIIISDNSTTAMTGGQDSAGTGKMAEICIGVGVKPEHIRVIEPLAKNFEENVAILREEIAYNDVSVILSVRECIQTQLKRKKTEKKDEPLVKNCKHE
ncbi:MAG TPA: thiamine pyrophosphate-dependent enzyme [Prolixibacteraceae bacterium]|nr:thiamine pyrophosphate-dependent enzyme [Prolixibacteraceae bacterium]